MAELVVTRLLQNPLGQVAPTGERGDIVRVSDGLAKVYLSPGEFDALEEEALRALLRETARQRAGKPAEPSTGPAGVSPPGATPFPKRRTQPSGTAGAREKDAGSVTDPRRAIRRPHPLW